MKAVICLVTVCFILAPGCSKKTSPTVTPPVIPTALVLQTVTVDGINNGSKYIGLAGKPVTRLAFSAPVNQSTVASSIKLQDKSGTAVPITLAYEKGDSLLVITPSNSLAFLTDFKLLVLTTLASKNGAKLSSAADIDLRTDIDPTPKYPALSDNALLDKVQRVTFKYFWDFGHPTSGLARERTNGDNNVVTSGGSGFGVMAIVAAIDRGFITRAEGLARLKLMTDFLQNTAQKFHGAFPHWLHGATGVVIPFSAKDNGADLVETSYLIQGLLCARQYFNGADAGEVALRNTINSIWRGVEWNWFRKNNEEVLYWHWSPNFGWDMNLQVRGWNECLITYALAASSPTFAIPKSVYDQGFARSGNMKNGKSFYGLSLPLGEDYGGPLFYSQYSFLGINPTDLKDAYADYWLQNKNHTLINYNYCKEDSKNHGYSANNWGLTASDIPNGYTASSPTNDVGVIAPTAALSAFPYTPVESMQALKYFYYTLGDKIWKENEFGFVDAFSLKELWFAPSYLAIDQGPIIVMIENYRSGLLWKLFMECAEVKSGMKGLGFTSPNLN
ncbi:MAG: glucoamylase family protein [Bacteroidota bacterium]